MYKDGQIGEIYKLIGGDIYTEDMPCRVLALFAFLEQQQSNNYKAKELFQLAKTNNFVKNFIDNLIMGKKSIQQKLSMN